MGKKFSFKEVFFLFYTDLFFLFFMAHFMAIHPNVNLMVVVDEKSGDHQNL